MGKNQRNRKLKKEEAKLLQKTQPKSLKERAATWPAWAQFLYRFSISFLILLPIALIVMWTIWPKNQNTNASSQGNMKARMVTDFGEIKFELYSKDAPKTVENFEKLAEKNYYNGLVFHRVIQEFMIQAGDPNCNNPTETAQCGAGGESAWGAPFEDEFNDHKIVAGTLAMANSGPNTNGSQFFIVTEKEQPHLDGKHTVFGQVTEGMEIVNAIAAVEVDESDRPIEDVKIKEIKIQK